MNRELRGLKSLDKFRRVYYNYDIALLLIARVGCIRRK